MSLTYVIFQFGVIKSKQVISVISKQVFRIFDYTEYFPFKTLLLGLGWTIELEFRILFEVLYTLQSL